MQNRFQRKPEKLNHQLFNGGTSTHSNTNTTATKEQLQTKIEHRINLINSIFSWFLVSVLLQLFDFLFAFFFSIHLYADVVLFLDFYIVLHNHIAI